MTTMDEPTSHERALEESTRLEVIKFYSSKVNQHVYWIITFILGGLTYLSSVTNIILFLKDKIGYHISLSFVISFIPLLFILPFLVYTISRTFYWDKLLSIATQLKYASTLEGNIYWNFQTQTSLFFSELYEKSKNSGRMSWEVMKYRLAFRVAKVGGAIKYILVYFICLVFVLATGFILEISSCA